MSGGILSNGNLEQELMDRTSPIMKTMDVDSQELSVCHCFLTCIWNL